MAEATKAPVPLPDPDRVQASVDQFLERFKAKRGLYIGTGLAILAVIIGVIAWLNMRPGATEATGVTKLWVRADAARAKLLANQSAAAEIAAVEALRSELDDADAEGLAAWTLATLHYREAFTAEKYEFEQRKPHFEKALALLEELEAEKYDGLIVARPKWFSSEQRSPIDRLRAQVEADLKYERENAAAEPQPTGDTVAVLRTSDGDVFLHFYEDIAKVHFENFVMLARKGTYNGTALHYVAGGSADPIRVHGGDPYTFFFNNPLKKDHILRWGKGTIGYELPSEEARVKVNHRPGIVTAPRAPSADWESACQFQIVLQPDRKLDRNQTPFAKVVEGLDVIERAAKRKTVSEHEPFQGDPDLTSLDRRDLIVEPVIVHKVIVFKDGQALEHDYALTEAEKSITSLKDEKAAALAEADIHGGRLLRAPDAEGAARRGLDIPYPEGADPEKVDAKGEYKPVWRPEGSDDDAATGNGDGGDGDTDQPKKAEDEGGGESDGG